MFHFTAFHILLPIYGIVLGSFIGVFYHRLIRGNNNRNIISRSECDKCHQKLRIWELFPLLSFLFLKGKCHRCKEKISNEYFWIELFFLVLSCNILMLDLHIIELYLILFVIGLLVIQAISDLLNKELFTSISFFVIICGLILSTSFATYSSIYSSIVGIFSGFFALFIINKIYYFLKKRDGIGGGDFILFGAILGLHGIEMFGPVLLIASVVTLGIGYLTSSLNKEMPFGTGLAVAGIIFLLSSF